MLKHLFPVLLLFAASCSEPQPEQLADFPVPSLRSVMFDVDALNRTIEPILTDPDQALAIASAARSMQRLSGDVAWSEYQTNPAFFGQTTQFNGYLSLLREGTKQLAESAEQQKPDLEGMRQGYIKAQQSCIACHKRFQPNI